jgi:hypothetical protein
MASALEALAQDKKAPPEVRAYFASAAQGTIALAEELQKARATNAELVAEIQKLQNENAEIRRNANVDLHATIVKKITSALKASIPNAVAPGPQTQTPAAADKGGKATAVGTAAAEPSGASALLKPLAKTVPLGVVFYQSGCDHLTCTCAATKDGQCVARPRLQNNSKLELLRVQWWEGETAHDQTLAEWAASKRGAAGKGVVATALKAIKAHLRQAFLVLVDGQTPMVRFWKTTKDPKREFLELFKEIGADATTAADILAKAIPLAADEKRATKRSRNK